MSDLERNQKLWKQISSIYQICSSSLVEDELNPTGCGSESRWRRRSGPVPFIATENFGFIEGNIISHMHLVLLLSYRLVPCRRYRNITSNNGASFALLSGCENNAAGIKHKVGIVLIFFSTDRIKASKL